MDLSQILEPIYMICYWKTFSAVFSLVLKLEFSHVKQREFHNAARNVIESGFMGKLIRRFKILHTISLGPPNNLVNSLERPTPIIPLYYCDNKPLSMQKMFLGSEN